MYSNINTSIFYSVFAFFYYFINNIFRMHVLFFVFFYKYLYRYHLQSQVHDETDFILFEIKKTEFKFCN